MHHSYPPQIRGRGEHRMLAAPAGLACKENCALRTQATTGQPGQPAFPAQWVTAYTWSPRCTGLSGHRRLAKRPARLDSSVGESGPHDFAVRENAFVGATSALEHPHVHRIPLPTSVTIAIRPSS